MPPNRCSLRRLLLRICAVSCLANVVFFALMLLVQPHPPPARCRTPSARAGARVPRTEAARARP